MLYRTVLASVLLTASVSGSLDHDISAILARPAFQNATVGVEVRQLGSGDILFSRDAYRSTNPASNQKLGTSSAALSILGAEFRYNTTVIANSRPVDGVIEGDLWLRGSGDPSLNSTHLARLADDLVKVGVKRVAGKVIGDGSRFDTNFLGAGWSWDDEPYYYSAQVSGLNCDGNVVSVSISPGETEGEAAKITINDMDKNDEVYVKVQSSATTTGGGSPSLSATRLRGRNIITISGSIPIGSKAITSQVTVEDPTAFTASRLVLALHDAGIEVAGRAENREVESKPPSEGKILASWTSEQLSDLLKSFLKPSDNLYGEALLKTIGYTASPESPGSAATGAAAMADFFASAGISISGINIADGSGLSRMDLVTARFICDLLEHIHTSFPEGDRKAFEDALPIGGVDGTLADRFVGTPVEGKVRGKTGSLSGVSALSGYVDGRGDGDGHVFSVLMSAVADSADARKGQEDIVLAIFENS